MTALRNTRPLVAALAMAVALPLAAPAAAGEDILVTSTSAMQEWQEEVTRKFDQRLELAEKVTSRRPSSGIVQIRFSLDEKGRPVDLDTHYNSSGVSGERAAAWAIRRLSNLDEAPIANVAGTRFQANVIYAENAVERDRFAANLRQMERTRLARADSEPLVSLGN